MATMGQQISVCQRINKLLFCENTWAYCLGTSISWLFDKYCVDKILNRLKYEVHVLRCKNWMPPLSSCQSLLLNYTVVFVHTYTYVCTHTRRHTVVVEEKSLKLDILVQLNRQLVQHTTDQSVNMIMKSLQD